MPMVHSTIVRLYNIVVRLAIFPQATPGKYCFQRSSSGVGTSAGGLMGTMTMFLHFRILRCLDTTDEGDELDLSFDTFIVMNRKSD